VNKYPPHTSNAGEVGKTGRKREAKKMATRKNGMVAKALPESANADPVEQGNVADVSEPAFKNAVEVYVESRTVRDEADGRMKQYAPIIIGYVCKNGDHTKPEHPDDSKLDFGDFRCHHQFYTRMDEAPAVAWVQQRLTETEDETERADLNRLLVPKFDLNREMWAAYVDRTDSPVPRGLVDRVENGSYKLVVKGLVNTTCPDCGAKIHKTTMNFCPGCGKKLK
jgi:hypothetical protein